MSERRSPRLGLMLRQLVALTPYVLAAYGLAFAVAVAIVMARA